MAATGKPTTQRQPVAQPVKVYFDASYLPPDHENGPSAAVGYVVTDARGNLISRRGYSLRNFVSSTHVEYQALIEALTFVDGLDSIEQVYVYGDAESVIECVKPDGEASPNDRTTSKFARKARTALERFDHCHLRTFQYGENSKPRDKNTRADALARRGHGTEPWNGDAKEKKTTSGRHQLPDSVRPTVSD